jgi:hypothetical protein
MERFERRYQGLLRFWAVFFFEEAVTNLLKQVRRSSSSLIKRHSFTVLAGAEVSLGAGFSFAS